jgi:hypothetical protein
VAWQLVLVVTQWISHFGQPDERIDFLILNLSYYRNKPSSMPENKDVEKQAGQSFEQKPLGFAALSSLMASDGDQELLIFRKFDEISARNLLYLQCELLSIEDRLKRCDRKLSKSGDMDLEEAAETWETMVEQAKDGKPVAQEMMELIHELRAKVKEYRK